MWGLGSDSGGHPLLPRRHPLLPQRPPATPDNLLLQQGKFDLLSIAFCRWYLALSPLHLWLSLRATPASTLR